MKQKDFLVILIPFFILTVAWVVFNVYHNYVTSTIEDPLSFQIIAIEGKFDTDTLDNIISRKIVSPKFELSPSVIIDIPPIESVPDQISTDSGEIDNTEQISTDSGELTQ